MEDINNFIEEFSNEEVEKEDEEILEEKSENAVSTFSILMYQLILCICVIIILILVNTFFQKEFKQIDSFLKNEFSYQQDFQQDFSKISLLMSTALQNIKPLGSDENTSSQTTSTDTTKDTQEEKSDEQTSLPEINSTPSQEQEEVETTDETLENSPQFQAKLN